MSETAKLKLPFIAPAQAQKHVTVNEALARVDACVQLSVESRTLTTPPLVVTEGETYLIPAGAVNAWSQSAGKIASFINGGWQYFDPLAGWEIWVADEVTRLTYDGAQWLENVLALSQNKAALRAEVVEFDFALSGGGASEDTGFVIPSHSSVWGVTGRILTDFTGTLSDWSLGVDGAESRYGTGLGLGAGAWLRGITGQPVTYYGATQLRLTADGGDFDAGTVRLAIHLMQFDLPEA